MSKFVFAVIAGFSGLVSVKACAADLPEPGSLPVVADLPDPLVMLDGTRVGSPEEWRQTRRPELKRLFEHYMYGAAPQGDVGMVVDVRRTDPNALDGAATLQEITLHLGISPPKPPVATIELLLVVPNAAREPAPVFVGMNFGGNHTLLDDPQIAITEHWMYPHQAGVVD
jgi:hypothetical protein